MYTRAEPEYLRAKLKAARRLAGGAFDPSDLPSNREIRDDLEAMARLSPEERRDLFQERTGPEEEGRVDRFQVYRMLLLPLEKVRQGPRHQPGADVLEHSLQVFGLVRDQRPYDEEFLLAALLHDVGKGIEPKDHEAAGLAALDGWITPRTAWLIEHHTEAHGLRDGTIGVRARRRLEAAEDFEELELLSACDRASRAPGVAVPDLDEALDYLRDLARTCGE
jgi:predicted HD phosphohydrolase